MTWQKQTNKQTKTQQQQNQQHRFLVEKKKSFNRCENMYFDFVQLQKNKSDVNLWKQGPYL